MEHCTILYSKIKNYIQRKFVFQLLFSNKSCDLSMGLNQKRISYSFLKFTPNPTNFSFFFIHEFQNKLNSKILWKQRTFN